MTDEAENNADKTEIAPEAAPDGIDNAEAQLEAEAPPAKQFLSKKMIIIAGGSLLVVILALVGVIMFGGGDASEAESPDEATPEQVESDAHGTDEATAHDEEPAAQEPHAAAETHHAPDLHVDEAVAHEPAVHEPEPTIYEPTEAEMQAMDFSADQFTEEELMQEADQSVIENIMSNLAFLDASPDAEASLEEAGMSKEDSLEAMDWLESEKAALATRERELDKRQEMLDRQDAELSRKLLVLEQAESARVNTLAKLYDGMDPRAVAQLMANLDDTTIVAILPRMKSKNASNVMALFPPQRAAKLSKQMITVVGN